ncbi:MAG: alpha/beta hydrolase [Deltaproteobacteria bacterium]|nr:alpha/beta hydrolase [Deltaproteobacteria bacterium]
MPYFLTKSGLQLNYDVSGEGKPILFLHGWGMSSRVWKYQVEHFFEKFKTITLDLRGHGESSPSDDYTFDTLAGDVKEFIEGLSLGPVSLVGWSMGGSVAIKVAGTYPEILHSLILVSTTPKFVASEDFPYGQPEAMLRRLERQIDRDVNRAMVEFCSLMVEGEPIIEEVWETVAVNEWPSKEILKGYLKTLADTDLRGELIKISHPTMIVHGMLDRISSHEAAVFMADRIKKVRLESHHDEGHAPFLTRPDWFNTELEGFLNEFRSGN